MLAPNPHPHRGLRLPVTIYSGDVPDAWRHAWLALPVALRRRVAGLDLQGLHLPAAAGEAAVTPEAGLGAVGGRLVHPAALRAAVQCCVALDACDALWVQLPADADPVAWAAWFDTAPGAEAGSGCGGASEPDTGDGTDSGGADLCRLEALVAGLNARHLAGELARDTLPMARVAQVEFATRVVLLCEAGLAPAAQQALRTWLHAWNPATPVQTHWAALAEPAQPRPRAAQDAAVVPSIAPSMAPSMAPEACAPCASLGLAACPPGAPVLAALQQAGLDLDAVAGRAGWAHLLDGRPWPRAAGQPLQTLLFQARDPFDPQRLLALLAQPWPGLLRMHGTVWLATRPDWVVAVSGHQRLLGVSPAGRWWAALPASRWPRDTALRQAVEEASIEPWGDRRQRIAFIGDARFDAQALRAALTACQLSYEDTHSAILAWRGLRDPLPRWEACDEVDAPAAAGLCAPGRRAPAASPGWALG